MEVDEEKVDIEMQDDDSDDQSQHSNSPEPLTDEEVEESQILEIEGQIKANPYLYDAHVQLINLRRKFGDLDEVRRAREEMSKLFPLTPELWLDWLTDEEKLASTASDCKKLISLFERAMKDYTSVSLWLEYGQYLIGQIGNELNVDDVRKTFEKALIAVGIHVTEGGLLWDAYREFELALYTTAQNSTSDPEEQQAKVKEQKNRIYQLYKRQLSVPLLHMEKTYKEFTDFFSDPVDRHIAQQYSKCLKKLEDLMVYENAIFESEAPHLKAYEDYIKYEKEKGDPTRVQNLYERALLDNCLLADLWLEYTKYLDTVIKDGNLILPTYERAIRNCPWSVMLWKNYAAALERHNQPHGDIKGVFEKALSSGFTSGDEYREIWLAYLDYLRRRIEWNGSHESELNDLNDVFERAIEHMMTYYKESDPSCSILQYRAKIEAKYCKNVSKGREIWNEIMNYGFHGVAEMWLNFANFERIYGDDKHYRKVLMRGLHSSSDSPESIGNALLFFEREEGTLETLDLAVQKYESHMVHVLERRQKKAEKEAERQQIEDGRRAKAKADKQAKLAEINAQKIQLAKKAQKSDRENIKMDSEGFKIPCLPSKNQSDRKENVHVPRQGTKRSFDDSEHEVDIKKSKVEGEEPAHGETVQHDPLKDERTIFLSNLAYTTDEEGIRELFSPVGNIEEIRLVRDYKGRSKGYCYVVYSSKDEAIKALEKDRCKLNDRPVFVSRCKDKRSGASSEQKFKFGTGLEKNKLFVKGIPFSTTEDELREIFKEYGKLKEVRLVTYRNGHSKGLAYVEYENENDAAAALVKTDGSQIGEHTISVAISNPPERKPKRDQKGGSSVTVSNLLGGGGSGSVGPRGKGRTQLSLVPRAVQRPGLQQRPGTSIQKPKSVQNGDSTSSSPSNINKDGKLSNSDFRDMLLKKT